MAPRYWVDDDVDGDWEGANNWSTTSGGAGGVATPTGSDDVFFDGNGTTNCTMTAASACLSIDFATAYSGILGNGANTVSIGTGGLDLHNSTGGLALGAGKWTCNGKWLVAFNQASFTRDSASLVELTGTGTVSASTNERFQKLTVSGTYTVSSGQLFTSSDVVISGSLTINTSGSTFFTAGLATSLNITGGTFTGSGNIKIRGSTFTVILGGSEWDIANSIFERSITLNPGTYNGGILFSENNGSRTLTFNAGTYTFTGPVEFDADVAAGTYTVDMDANNPTVTFEDDVTLSESLGTLTFNAGTNAITFSGTTVYTDSTAAIQNLGDVEVDGTSLQLATEMECDDFNLTSGALDANGQTLDIAGNMNWVSGSTITDPVGSTFIVVGNFTANAQDISGASGAWNLQVTGTAVASGVGNVAYSNAGGFTEIDASVGPWTDSNNNTNWNFGAVGLSIPIAMRHYKQMMGVA